MGPKPKLIRIASASGFLASSSDSTLEQWLESDWEREANEFCEAKKKRTFDSLETKNLSAADSSLGPEDSDDLRTRCARAAAAQELD